MAGLDLKGLISKLNPSSQRALEGAAGLCLSKTNYNVEIEHWLVKLLEQPGNDICLLFKHFGVDQARVMAGLMKAIDGFKTGNARPPLLSPEVCVLIRQGWLIASVDHREADVRGARLLQALLSEESITPRALAVSDELRKISPDVLAREASRVFARSIESPLPEDGAAGGAADGGATGNAAGGAPRGPTTTPSLDQYTIDLTARAKAGKIDPVLGREAEVRQIVDILTRRRQNNPILTGEAGVGKTAVVEGFARRIADGDVPEPLKKVQLRTLDLGLLQAGAGVKGEFENRLKGVIDEVKKSPVPIILFIDEAHTLIGAGGAAGQGDAANMLKPALARGELRTIAATTWAEYKKYFEKDAALARRFQVVKIEEPDDEMAIRMMRGMVGTLEKHHSVSILDEAVVESVKLSRRYLSGRQLPDKSVSLLDTACARVAIGQVAVPPAIEDARRRLDALTTAIGILEREEQAGSTHTKQLEELRGQQEEVAASLASLEKRFAEESQLVGEIRDLRKRLTGHTTLSGGPTPPAAPVQAAPAQAPPAQSAGGAAVAAPAGAAAAPEQPLSDAERQTLLARLRELEADLARVQGDEPLLSPCVDGQQIAEVIAGWTGIPVGRMVSDEIRGVLELKTRMEERIVGQSHALETIAERIKTSRAGLTDPRRPVGVFLLAGPSGVGKTETALTLADLLFGGESHMTVINMSEFKEEHKVSLLMGSPPGYVGYGEGGVLTEAVRRRPYGVVLLDEMEKAHPGVQDIFYQVFDKGMLKDGEGRDIDFKNTVIIMTSNAGTDTVMKLCADPATRPDAAGLAEALHGDLLKVFKPAFLGRLTVLPYFPLSDEVLRSICELKLRSIGRRLEAAYKASFGWEADVVKAVVDRCHEVDSGARNIDHVLSGGMLPDLSTRLLGRMAEGRPVERVQVRLDTGGSFDYLIE
jgi:type VI secretion system protein VasG